MKQYHYQEQLNINVEVYANSKKEAEKKVTASITKAFAKMPYLWTLNKDIADASFDTLDTNIEEIK